MDLASRTLSALDWPVVLAALAEHALTPRGAREALALAPCASAAEVRALHDAMDEVKWLDERVVHLPLGDIGDVWPQVERAARGVVLEAAELAEVGATLRALHALDHRAHAVAEDCPVLAGLAAAVAVDPGLRETLSAAFDDKGQLSAATYPALGELRGAITSLHAAIRSTLDELVSGDALEAALQDRFVTQRNNRYVLPIKASHRRRDMGIVHGASGTGATVYVEPAAVVELNNRLRLAEGQLAAEERRILTQLSVHLGAFADEVATALAAATEVDLVHARFGLAVALGAERPRVGEEGVLVLSSARHPVLVLRGVPVVANDLALTAHRPVLVLTGPNAGGKTVALKTLGLCALLVQHGCWPPAGEESRVDWFEAVLADIGDSQTVVEDLSSFSAHLLALGSMLEAARPGALLLLDELASGTDPAQGGALARAVLEALADRGPRVGVTTHYAQLKGMAAADPRFAVAAMEYRDGQPTFRALADATGESHALATAARLGLDPAIITRAWEVMDAPERALSEALEALDAERAAAEATARRAGDAAAAAEARAAALEAERARISARSEALETEAAAAFVDRVQAAEAAIAAVVADLQRDPTSRKAAAARASVRTLRQVVPEEAVAPAATPPPADLAVGDRVRLERLDRVGTVEAVSDGEIAVATGSVTVRVKPAEVQRLAPEPPRQQPRRRRGRKRKGMTDRVVAPGALDEAVRTPANTLDMRGMRVDEGFEAAEAFFDRALLRSADRVFLLHGHGTGKLKQGLRRWLPSCPYVATWAPAAADQGGDAYTVVSLRGR